MMRPLPWLVLLSLAAAQSGARADQAPPADGAAWTPQGCGEEPARPVLDLSDRAKYNHSADVVNEYEAKAKSWDSCVMKQANVDMEAISTAAKGRMAGISHEATQIQTRVYAGFGAFTTQFKAAQERFGKEP